MPLIDVEQARANMVSQQILPWNMAHPLVLHLMGDVKREDFVPRAYRSLAFADISVPISHGQVMLTPAVQARLLQDAAVRPTDRVLEVGTGTGFMTAVLAHMAQSVVSLEINHQLAATARVNLQRAGIHNCDIQNVDGALVVVPGAFDVIVLGGSVLEAPAILLDQLKEGGRLVGILGDEPLMQASVITRTGSASFSTVSSWSTVAPALQNFKRASTFRF